MRSTAAFLALAAGSHALVAREERCCSGITAYGGPGGSVGQLSDGQNRLDDSRLPQGRYCLDTNGGIIDEKSRGCILTPPTSQWQCDKGAPPTLGFETSCNGTLSYKGQDTFWSCPTGDNGGFNIYKMPVSGEPHCVPIWLMMEGCGRSCPHPPPKVSPQPPAPPKAPAACPAELTGSWEFPHLIIPVNSAEPERMYRTQYNGTASGTLSSIFNFDIPPSYVGKKCSLEFLFPTHKQLETSSYEYKAGQFKLAFLDGVANQNTNYVNKPKVLYEFGDFMLKPGSATVVGQCPGGCAAGKTVSFMVSPVGSASLNYFQDSNPCPIGLYITAH